MTKRKTPALPSNEVKPAITEPGAARDVSFSPEDLQAVIAKVTADAVAMATAALRAEMQQALGAKPAEAAKAPTMSIAGKTERAIQNELLAIRLFKKAGYGVVVPHQVRTFNRWQAIGLRPVEGSKSVRVGNLRLFHKSQCRVVTAAETAKNAEQQAAAVARHDKAANVVPINANPQ